MKKNTFLFDLSSNNPLNEINKAINSVLFNKNLSLFCVFGILVLSTFLSTKISAQTYTDNASNSAYSTAWSNGTNGGTGFAAWSLSSDGANAGHFKDNPSNASYGMSATNIGTTAFGMYGHSSQYAYALRNFSSSMSVGDVFTFNWSMNYDCGSSGSKGWELKSGSTVVFSATNTNSATISYGGVASGTISTNYGTSAMLVTITRTSSTQYSVSISRRLSTDGTFSTTITSSSAIDNLRIYIGGQQTNEGQRNMFFNNFQIQKPNQYRSKASGDWSAAGTWETSTDGGSTWSNAASAPVSSLYSTITIQNLHTVSQNQNYSTASNNNIVVASGGTLNMTGASGNFQFNTMSVSGTLVRNSISYVYNGTTITINNGGKYKHAVNGGSVPTATWATGSTFEVTGITSATSFDSGAIQSYHHVVWNCASQTSNFSFGGLTTVNGDFTIQSTGASPSTSSNLLLTNSSTLTTTIGGNLSISGGYFAPFGAGTTGNCSLSIAGDLSLSTGTFDVFRQASNTGTLNLSGNFSMTSGTLTKGGSGTANFNFAKSGTQIYSKSGGTIASAINFTVNNGSILNVGTSLIDGSTGTFNLSSGASLITANTGGIASTGSTGSIQVGGTRTYSTGANLTFNGSTAQVTGTGFTGAANLTINNIAGVTLSNNSSLSGTLTLTSGAFTVGSSNTITVGIGGTISSTSGSIASGTGAGTFTFSGTGTITGTVGFNNVNIAGGVNFGSAATINGILSINSGGYVNTNPPIYASGSTLKYNTTSTYGRGSEWNSTSGAGYPYHVQISNSTTLNMGANSGTAVARQCAGDITIDASSTFSMNTNAMSAAVTIIGNIVNNGTITLSSTIGGDIKCHGNITDNGTFDANNRAIFFNGGNSQVIQGTGVFDIPYVRINKTGGSVQLASNLTCIGPNGGNAMEIEGATSVLDLNGFTLNLGASGITSTYNSGISTSGFIKGSASSSISVLGNGALGTLKFDQTTPGTTNALNNFTISRASGSIILGNSIAVSALSIASTTSLNLGTYTHTANSLTLNGSVQTSSSSYGGTSSPAATVNTTFFAATSGFVNVGTCSSYSLTSTTANACLNSGASVTLTNTTTANLPVGTYTINYTLNGANSGTSSQTMNVTEAGTGSFSTTSITNAGSTTITINSITKGCVSNVASNNTATITITTAPSAGTLSGTQAICSTGTTTFESTFSGGAWSSASTGVATIDASSGVITPVGAGSSVITYTVSGSGGCSNATATRTVTVTAPTASAGSALSAICQSGTSEAMGGSVGGGATGGTWSGGTGTWSDATDVSLTTYTPGSSESGSITLTLTTSGGSCGSATASKTITINAPTASAGSALSAICQSGTSQAMGGSVGGTATGGTWSGGTGTWSDATDVSLTTYTPGSSESGSITLTLTTSGGSCGSATASKTITINAPTTSDSGSDISQCNTETFTLSGNTPTVGTGLWTISGTGSITDNTSPTSDVTGVTAGSSATLTWTISNGSCAASTSSVVLTNNAAPTTSDAGSAITQCDTDTFTLAGNTALVGTGLWTISGTGSITDNTSPTSDVTGVTAGSSATLTWTISNGSCAASTSSVVLTNNAAPTTSDAGSAITQCNTDTFTLAGNTALVGTGLWTISGTGSITDNTSPTSDVTGVTAGSSATLTWTISNGSCAASTSSVVLTNNAAPTTSDAGSAITQCNTDTFTLSGNTPLVGTGLWTISGTGSITDNTSPTSDVTGVTAGSSATLTWTISNGSCAASTSSVVLTNNAAPTTSDAGSAITQCNTDTFTLAGNTALVGTGLWTISGTGSITDNTSPTSDVTGVTAGSSATLTWTISNGSCAASTSSVVLTNNAAPTTSDAGSAITQCDTDTFTLAGNTALVGTGLWTISGTGSITDNTSPTSDVTGVTAGSSATLTWTISNGSCAASTSSVVLTNNAAPTTSDAGSAITQCDTDTFTLAGNTALVGTGLWTISGTGSITDNTSPTSDVTGVTAGSSATLTWTISNGSCAASTSSVVLTNNAAPTTSDAGSAITQCNTDTFTLAGNTALVGTGLWTISGTGSITDNTSPTSDVTGVTAGSSATLTWTISNGSCAASTSSVVLTNNAAPTTSDAGSAITQCNTDTFTLAGNTALVGTGLWTISGTGSITDNTSPTSDVTGVTAGSSATLTWTISNGSCAASTSSVVLTNNAAPTTSDAGSAITQCNTDTFTLAGNTALVGTGLWTISGTGSITDNTSPTSDVTGVTAGSSATLTWTISNGSCAASTSSVVLTNNAAPTTSDAGSAITQCDTDTFTLAGNTALVGTGLWTISGTGSITDNTSPTSDVTGVIAGSSATLTWTISNGSCAASTSSVVLTNNAPPTTSDAGSAITQCNTDTFTLAGNTALVGTGLWTISGTGSITDNTSPTSDVTGVTAGSSATLTWTISNGSCADSTSSVVLTNNAAPTTSDAGSAITQCDTDTFTLAGNTALVGTGLWTISGTGSITDNTSPTSDVTGVTAGSSATLTWTISNGSCADSTSSVVLTNNAAPTTSDAGSAITQCDTDTFTLAGNTALVGTGLWTISGTGSITDNTSPTSDVTGVTAGSSATLTWTISNGSCAASTDTVVLTNNPAPNPGTSPSSSVCSGKTATITLTGATGGIQWQQSADGSTSWDDILFTSETPEIYTTDALTVTNFYRSLVTDSVTGCTATSTPIEISIRTTTWDGSGWDNGAPNGTDGTKEVVFEGNYISSGDIQACSCTVNSGDITISAGNTLTLLNGIDGSGTMTFEDTATLLQDNNVVNTGVITYKRKTSALNNNYDFVYWGSPVQSQSLARIWMSVTSNDTFYTYNGGVNWAPVNANATMAAGVGYIARARNNGVGTDWNNVSQSFTVGSQWEARFHGVPNNGDITASISKVAGNFNNLIANPYPSAIDLEAFNEDTDNAGKLTGNFSFWTHSTAIANNAYTAGDYLVFNANTGVGTSSNQYVKSGQSFFVELASNDSDDSALVTFKNSHRVSGTGGRNSGFYRTAVPNTPLRTTIENHNIWLNLSNAIGGFKQSIVQYAQGASNNYDLYLDAKSMEGNSNIDFYSTIPNKKLTINSRTLPFDNNDSIDFGYHVGTAGTFQIAIDHVNGLFLTGENIYLEDKLLNTTVDLRLAPYSFTTAIGTFNTRFVLHYLPTSTLGTGSLNIENSVQVITNEKATVYSSNQNIKNIVVFDVLGRKIDSYKNVGMKQFTMNNLNKTMSGLFVKITLENDVVVTKKIVF